MSFLRDELNYVVVKSWDAAGEGLRLLQKGCGRDARRSLYIPKSLQDLPLV